MFVSARMGGVAAPEASSSKWLFRFQTHSKGFGVIELEAEIKRVEREWAIADSNWDIAGDFSEKGRADYLLRQMQCLIELSKEAH